MTPVYSQPSPPEDFSEYYHRIRHLPDDSLVWAANMLVPKWQRDLDFLDGYKIPDFTAIDIHGQVQNVTYKGKLTLLTFWFIACPPCIEEIPLLNGMQDKYKGQLEVVSICRDAELDIKQFLMKHPIHYTIIPDASDLIDNRFEMFWGYPKNILVGPDGRVLACTRGFLGTDDLNYQKIEQHILKSMDE